MTCPSCGADTSNAKFCPDCGTPQRPPACPSCGAPAGHGRFCADCGAALGSTPPRAVPAAPTAERRRTSVLFADLVGFTTLSEARDPEEVRELLSRYFDIARTVIARYGGTVEKFIGDAVMAVWGVPVAHEDDAERAVRAGLDLVVAVTALGEDVGLPGLALRVGVVTGEVAVTLRATGEGMVAGDAVNTAARVQSAATPGTVWVDDATRLLTAAAVSYTESGEHLLKGKAEPVALFQARAVVAAVGGAQRVDGLEAPFLGRDRELRLVKELFHASIDEARPRLVLVSAVAGMGKSRLGWEFEKYVDGLTVVARWHRGRCLSYGDGVAFWALAEMVRSRLDVTESDSREDAERKLAAGLQRWVPDADERAWVGPRVAVLLGQAEGSTFDRLDLFAAWSVFFDRVGAGQPLVLLVDDLHHADSGLLDFLEHLLETARFPLFLLGLTRPDLLARRPSLTTGRRSTTLHLDPMNDTAMTALVDGLVDGLPPAARAALVVRAEGVPLYAVETVRSLIDRDAVVPREGRYVFVDDTGDRVDLATLAAPASLQTLIAARLDALTADERRLVQDASVLGLSFTSDALTALTGGDIDVPDVLARLLHKEILELQGDPRSPERGQYRFLQALVRQVAYDTLSRRDRKSRHLAVAAHLGRALEEPGDLAAVLAQHHLDALDASSTGDSDHAELAARARELLLRAARRAAALGSPAEALRHAETALDREPEPSERNELLTLAAGVARMSNNLDRAIELAREARAGYDEAGLDLPAVRAVVIEAEALRGQSRLQQAVDLLLQAYEPLRDRTDAQPQLLSLTGTLAAAHLFLGNHAQAQEYATSAMILAEAGGDVADIVTALSRLSTCLLYAGSPTASGALLLESIRLGRQHSLTANVAMSLSNLASLTYPRNLAEALPYAQEALTLLEQIGDRGRTAAAMINVSVTTWLAGEWDRVDALTEDWTPQDRTQVFYAGLVLVQARTTWSRGEPVSLPTYSGQVLDDAYDRASVACMQALVQAQAGDAAAAAALAEDAVRDYHLSYGYEDDVMLFWSLAAELALQAADVPRLRRLLEVVGGAPGSARTPLLTAYARLVEGQLAVLEGGAAEDPLRDAISRMTAYGAPYPTAQAQLSLGAWLAAHGRVEEASSLLDAAGETVTRLRARPALELLQAARQLGAVEAV